MLYSITSAISIIQLTYTWKNKKFKVLNSKRSDECFETEIHDKCFQFSNFNFNIISVNRLDQLGTLTKTNNKRYLKKVLLLLSNSQALKMFMGFFL